MIECKVVAIVAKLVPSSFAKAITQCNKPTSLTKIKVVQPWIDWVVSLTSNNPIVICMEIHMSLKKLISKAKVSTLPWDIHRSKLVDVIVIDVRLFRTCWFMVFLTITSNIYFTKEQNGN